MRLTPSFDFDVISGPAVHRGVAADWTPASWRSRPAKQAPSYPDAAALRDAEAELAARPGLVAPGDIRALRTRLADVPRGRAFLLQGGDCAERIHHDHRAAEAATLATLRSMGKLLELAGRPVVTVARIAGQFAKPRSSDTETRDGLALPSYRGDIVNDAGFDDAARAPDPRRMIDAYDQAARSLAAGHGRIFSSHEALLLPYEQALVRRDGDAWVGTSGHMLWIGDRTRQPDHAHVEFLRGVANPLGIKCGPSLDSDDLLRLLDTLNPRNEAGRITLITRMGADGIEAGLPPLLRVVQREGRVVGWCCDPMHGNTVTATTGHKTRPFARIASEMLSFMAIHAAEGTHAGGLHLEMTGLEVTECTGGPGGPNDDGLAARYETLCDPRLNAAQAMELARLAASVLE